MILRLDSIHRRDKIKDDIVENFIDKILDRILCLSIQRMRKGI